MIDVRTFETPSLGDRSYLVSDGEVAVVIDPQRDIERFLAAADELGVRITHVLETHLHNDYVSGGLALAGRTGAAYLIATPEDVAFDRVPVQDGDEVTTGQIRLRAVHTPGHTPHHLSYVLLRDSGPSDVFSGGSLLFAAVGRPDLIAPDRTDELARSQYRSVRTLARELPDDTLVRPTHGFGSHCATVTEEILRDGTVGAERGRNPALTTPDEDTFVRELLADLHPYPAYYAHMGPANASGPAAPDLELPRSLDAAALERHLAQGHWLVDLRTRRAYAASHLAGTINVELRNDLPTYLGWIVPWDVPLVLLGNEPDEIREAQLLLSRIGIDRPVGMGVGGPEGWHDGAALSSWPVRSWHGLAEERARRDDLVVLDVREGWEYDSGHHPDARHIPFYELPDRLGELPEGEVWVYCATGNRATVAASLLANAGREVVLIDDFCLPGDSPGAQEDAATALT